MPLKDGKLIKPDECRKRGHEWKRVVHQQTYQCVQCHAEGLYDQSHSSIYEVGHEHAA